MAKLQPRPTDAELEILRIIWDLGPCTVRQVHEELTKTKETGYTTTLKLMQIMTDKGLLVRDESERTHIYRSKLTQTKAQRHLLNDLMQRVFGGSAQQLVMQALSSKKAKPEELAEIRKLLDQLERRRP